MQTAENLLEHGLLDAVLPIEELAEVADRALQRADWHRARGCRDGPRAARRESLPDAARLGVDHPLPATRPAGGAARCCELRRHRRRARCTAPAQGEQDPGLLLALARFGGAPCVVLGQDRRRQTMDRAARPGRRCARPGAACGWPHELRAAAGHASSTPPGAALSKEAEEGGLAGEIARCLAELVMLDAPTVCVLLGQGTGGGALALVPADRVICAAARLAVAAAARGRVGDPAPRHRPRRRDGRRPRGCARSTCCADGIVDRIVAEHPDAADEPADFCARMAQVLEHELALLLRADPVTRRAARLARYRALG